MGSAIFELKLALNLREPDEYDKSDIVLFFESPIKFSESKFSFIVSRYRIGESIYSGF